MQDSVIYGSDVSVSDLPFSPEADTQCSPCGKEAVA